MTDEKDRGRRYPKRVRHLAILEAFFMERPFILSVFLPRKRRQPTHKSTNEVVLIGAGTRPYSIFLKQQPETTSIPFLKKKKN